MKKVKSILKSFWKERKKLIFFSFLYFKRRYVGSVLGFAWSILEPLFFILIYSLIFPFLLKVDFFSFVVFLILGFIPFRFLRRGSIESMKTLIDESTILGKINLPPYILILSKTFSYTISFLLESLVFFSILLLFIKPSLNLLYFPLSFLSFVLFCAGLSLGLAVYYPKYRDLEYILNVFFEGMFFLTPILYRAEMLPIEIRDWYMLNPLASMVYIFQASFLANQLFSPSYSLLFILAYSFFSSLLIFYWGIKTYQKRIDRIVGRV